MALEIGSLIIFSYPAVHKQGTRAHDKYPNVLVLHPSWQGCMHGLNFNYLTDDEINTIRMLMDPMFEVRYRESLERKNPNLFRELERIITTPSPFRNSKVTSPYEFYRGMIKPFLYGGTKRDCYRLYKPEKMTNIRVVQRASHMVGEDSLTKYKKEQEEMANAAKMALQKAQTPQEKAEAEKMLKDIEAKKGLSQRKSLLTHFADWFKSWKGPRFRR